VVGDRVGKELLLKSPTLLNKADLIHIKDGKSAKGSRTKGLLLTLKKVSQKTKFVYENLNPN